MVKTRFAPSPTGFLHIGGVRTALFAYLYAKHCKGLFVLRIEDTDQARSTDAATQAIIDGMNWLGLTPDEGPFYQMQRLASYKKVIDQLLSSGQAYRCSCSVERLDALREAQLKGKEKPRYDGCCREQCVDASVPHVVRFKNPQAGSVSFVDKVYGELVFQNKELDDFVILRTDKVPTYNFTVVVDDHEMGITDVVRGDDHLNNTPKQINLYNALNYAVPCFTHLPMILNEAGSKLSKRDGAASVLQYRDAGFLPEALLNYLVRLGWSHGDQEIFTLDEMVAFFDGAHINKSAARLSEEKLLWLNQHYLKLAEPARIASLLSDQFAQLGVDCSAGPALVDVVVAQRERVKTLAEMAQRSRYFYEAVDGYDEKAAKKHLKEENLPILSAYLLAFKAIECWSAETAHSVILRLAEQFSLKLGKVAQPLRVALTGTMVSPPLDQTLALLGKAVSVSRVESAKAFIENQRTE